MPPVFAFFWKAKFSYAPTVWDISYCRVNPSVTARAVSTHTLCNWGRYVRSADKHASFSSHFLQGLLPMSRVILWVFPDSMTVRQKSKKSGNKNKIVSYSEVSSFKIKIFNENSIEIVTNFNTNRAAESYYTFLKFCIVYSSSRFPSRELVVEKCISACSDRTTISAG